MRPDAEVIDDLALAWLDQHRAWIGSVSTFARLIWPADPMAALERLEALDAQDRILLGRRTVMVMRERVA